MTDKNPNPTQSSASNSSSRINSIPSEGVIVLSPEVAGRMTQEHPDAVEFWAAARGGRVKVIRPDGSLAMICGGSVLRDLGKILGGGEG